MDQRCVSDESTGVRKGKSVLLIACGALAREIKAVQKMGGWEHVQVHCLPAELHNTPEKIPDAVRAVIEAEGHRYRSTFVGYADCGTGGALDRVLEPLGCERIPGAHCYEFFAGRERFASLHEAEPGTFYLTDFLVRHFDRLVVRGLGIDRHPELRDEYFRNYRRVVYLAQTRSTDLEDRARRCADRLGLAFETRYTGLDPFADAMGAGCGPEVRESTWRT